MALFLSGYPEGCPEVNYARQVWGINDSWKTRPQTKINKHMNIDIGRSVTYPFEDPRWAQKLVVLVLIGFVPGLNIIVWGGYALTIARNVLQNERFPMPDWANWSDIAVRGLLSIVATFIYYIPALLVSCCLWLIGVFGGPDSSGLLTLVRCVGALFALMYVVAVNLLLNVGHVRYAQTDQFSVYMDLGRRIDDLRSESSLFVTLFVYQLILALVAGAAAAVLAITCIGLIVIGTLASLANGYVLGHAVIATRRAPLLA